MSGSPVRASFSKRSICALVSAIEAFCGRFQSTISSARSDEGKNCCCTKRMPTSDGDERRDGRAMVIQRQRMQTVQQAGEQ